MDMKQLTEFFMWCSILNIVLFTFAFVVCSVGRTWIYKIHRKFFPLKDETFDIIFYTLFMFYKTIIFVFFIMPYVVLMIMK